MSQPTNEIQTQPAQFGEPVPSAPPVYAAPPVYSAPPAYAAPSPAPEKKSKAGMIFGILAIVFLLAAGALGGLYYVNKSDSDRTIADQKANIASLEAAAKAKDAELTKAKSDLTTATSEAATAKAAADKLTACEDAVKTFFAALRKGDDKAGEKAAVDMASKCDAL